MPNNIQIFAIERESGNSNVPVVLGLSDASEVFEWQYENGEWRYYRQDGM